MTYPDADTWYELWEYDKKHRRGGFGEYLGTYPDTFFSLAAAIKERKEIAGPPDLRSRWRLVKRTPQGYFDIDGTQLTGADWIEIEGGVTKQ